MLNLGWAKAKRKDNCEWCYGYIFKHDKFGDGSEVNVYLVSTAEGGIIEERQVDFKMVWEETVCHDTMWFADGNPVFVGDNLHQNDEVGTVVWDDNYASFQIKVGNYIWDLDNYTDAENTGNIFDDFVPVEVVPSNIATEVDAKEINPDDENYEELNMMR